jgi:hypothetical protein
MTFRTARLVTQFYAILPMLHVPRVLSANQENQRVKYVKAVDSWETERYNGATLARSLTEIDQMVQTFCEENKTIYIYIYIA